MIQVNNRDFEWEEGLTVEKLLKKKNYVFHRIIVRINGELIPKGKYATTQINDGDDVKAIHIFGGG